MSADVLADGDHTNRAKDQNGNLWLVSKTSLDSPSDDSLPLFKGDFANAKVHAFWSEHSQGVNLIYWFFYGYNRGKRVAGSIYDNHMGDIEHVVVRLQRQGGTGDWAPTAVYYAHHTNSDSIPGFVQWANVPKDSQAHPIVYSAKGSHGCYPTAGSHHYGDALGTALIDICDDEGTPWKTWEHLVPLDYYSQTDLSGAGAYPDWMGKPGTPDYKDHVIFRWGNPAMVGNAGDQMAHALALVFKPSNAEDVIRFQDGPTGPPFKDVWGEDLN
jgi:hypothetical protein